MGHIAKTYPLKAAAGKKKHPFKITSAKAVPEAPAMVESNNHEDEQLADESATQERVVVEEQANDTTTRGPIVGEEQAANNAPQEQGTNDELGSGSSTGLSSAPTVLAYYMLKSTGKNSGRRVISRNGKSSRALASNTNSRCRISYSINHMTSTGHDYKEVGYISLTCPYPNPRLRHPFRSTYLKGDQKASSTKQPAGEKEQQAGENEQAAADNEQAAPDNATGDFCVRDDPFGSNQTNDQAMTISGALVANDPSFNNDWFVTQDMAGRSGRGW